MQINHILLFGAGKSATVLIDYLIANAEAENWQVTIGDANEALIITKTNNANCTKAVALDINDTAKRQTLVKSADLVISMMPPALHFLIAQDCILYKKNLLTASYVDARIKLLQNEIEENDLLFLCEMGLDPGIDHMSAMQLIDTIHASGNEITSFKSHCGGLVAPESDDNPWHYKISWNPRNVVLAGKAGALYKSNGSIVAEKYEELFKPDRSFNVNDEIGFLGYYPNRDSLPYIQLYGLDNVATFMRTTLRYPDFLDGWANVVHLGLTNEEPLYETDGMSLAEFFKAHFGTINIALSTNSLALKQLFYLGMDDNKTRINKGFCSAADVLQFALETKLVLLSSDKDMVVMVHEIEYKVQEGKEQENKAQISNEQNKKHFLRTTLIVKGNDNLHTAMAKTVGLPLGIAAKLILNGTIKARGLQIPTKATIYKPVLEELKKNGIVFTEEFQDA